MEEQTKEVNTGLYLIYAVIFVIVLILFAIASAYAYFRVNVTKSETLSNINAQLDCLNISYGETGTINDILSLNYRYPITDAYATGTVGGVPNVTPVTVTVTNNCTNNIAGINYTLALTTLAETPANDDPSEYIPNNKIRMRVLKKIGNGEEIEFKSANYLSNLSSLSSGNAYNYLTSYFATSTYNTYDIKNYFRIDSNNIANSTTITYKIQFWIDYYEGDSAMYTSNEAVHDTSYDNSTQDLNFKAAISLVTNPDTNMEQSSTYNITTTSNEIIVPNSARVGSTVTLTANTSGYAVASFKLNGTTMSGNSFTMPVSDVTITDVVIIDELLVDLYNNPNYSIVEYIESSGTQYIDTGVIVDSSNYEVDMEYQYTSVNSNYETMAGCVATIGGNTRFYVTSPSTTAARYVYGSDSFTRSNWVATDKHTIVFNNSAHKIIEDNVEIGTANPSNFQVPNVTLGIFAIHSATGWSYQASGKLYYLKIYDNGTLVRYMVPTVRNSDSKAGLYDLVNDVFYTDAAGGNFTVPS